jgi:hypothetical protein
MKEKNLSNPQMADEVASEWGGVVAGLKDDFGN